MADVTFSGGTIAKAAPTNALTLPVLLGTPAFDAIAGTIVQAVRYEDLTPNPATQIVTATWTTGVITFSTPQDPSVIRRGATIQDAGTSFDNTQKVNAVTLNAAGLVTSCTISPSAASSGAANLTFTPPIYDATLFWIRTTYRFILNKAVGTVSDLQVTAEIVANPSAMSNDFNADGTDDAVIGTGSSVATASATIEMSALLKSLGVNQS
jgi:hypothetical protein